MARLVPVTERGYVIGEQHHRAKYSDATVRRIRDMHEIEGLSYRIISTRLGVHIETVRSVCMYRVRSQAPHDWKRIR